MKRRCRLVHTGMMDEDSSWQRELSESVENPDLSPDNRLSNEDRNVLALPSTSRNSGFRNGGLKHNILPLVVAAMVDFVSDTVQDGDRVKTVLSQILVRWGWVPAVYLSDSYLSLRNSVKSVLNACIPVINSVSPAVDKSLLAREIRFSPFASSRYHSEFEELELIGKGGFGKVYVVRSRIDNCRYAMKKISFTFVKNEPMIKAINEVRMLASLQHKNIVRYYSAWAELDLQRAKVEHHIRIREVRTSESTDEGDPCEGTSKKSPTEKDPAPDSSSHSWAAASSKKETGQAKGRFWDDDESASSSASTRSSDSESSEELSEPLFLPAKISSVSRAKSSVPSPVNACVPFHEGPWPKAIMYVQMELCTKTLDDYLKQRSEETPPAVDRRFNENVIKQLFAALSYIHKKNIIHRDVKPCNLFLRDSSSSFPRLLLGDFGLACHENNNHFRVGFDNLFGEDLKDTYHSAGVGTAIYSAPEQLSSDYDTSVDVYSAGIVAFELYSPSITTMERHQKIGHLREGQLPPGFEEDWPFQAALIKSMCNRDPLKRPRAFEVASRLELIEKRSVEALMQRIASDGELIRQLEEKVAKLEQEVKRLKAK